MLEEYGDSDDKMWAWVGSIIYRSEWKHSRKAVRV